MKHLKIFENYTVDTNSPTKLSKPNNYYSQIIREQCDFIQRKYLNSRDDELMTKLQYYQHLIRQLENNEYLSERDIDNIKEITKNN